MKITYIKFAALLILVSLIAESQAQTAGKSGLSFLKFGFGARNIAMGDAGASVSNDVTSLFYNPARLANQTGNEILFMHNEWIQDVRSEVLGVRSDIAGIPLAIGLNVSTVNDIEVRQIPGEPLSKFNANFFFASLSTGFNILDELSFGVTAKYIYEGIFVDEANGYAVDFGLNYKTVYDGLSVAGVVKNIGSMNDLRSEATKLPVEIRLGPAYTFSMEQNKLDFVTAVEFQKYTATDDIHLNAGVEIVYDKTISLRGGYLSGYESKSFGGGVGLNWGSLSFDYALSPFALEFGTGHSISLSFKF
ncbi:MAG: PorV/PorQ family protein [Ignavibacteriales bacterium]|nr:MAG: PorV/PorQ family protein [Ignavibacteriales bacterium]